MSDPLASLERAREVIATLPDAEVRSVLNAAVYALLEGEDPRAVIGLDRGRYVQLRQARRNYHLRNSAAILGERGGWETAKALRRHAVQFDGITWPRWRDLDHPPATASPLQIELWKARKAWRFPYSSVQFGNILESALL